jgi:hypothetical protein
MTSTSIVQVRSGVGTVTIPCAFDQLIRIQSVTVPYGTNQGQSNVPTPSTSYTLSISASTSDNHSSTVRAANITIVGLSGIVASVNRQYRIKGFANRQLTLTYPEYDIAAGVSIVNPADVTCRGIINTSPPLDVAYVYDSTGVMDDAREYSITGNTIYISRQVINFGYIPSTTITLTISES